MCQLPPATACARRRRPAARGWPRRHRRTRAAPPERAEADADGGQRQQHARGQEHECQQHGEVALPAARLVALERVLRREHPEEPVGDDAGTACGREHDERDPDEQHVDAQVVGEAARNAAQHPAVAAAVQPPQRLARIRSLRGAARRCSGRRHPLILPSMHGARIRQPPQVDSGSAQGRSRDDT